MSDVRNIGARISTNPVATVRPIEGTSLFPLGQLVEAKVAAVLADGLFKFISADGGEFELPLPEKLPEGTPVRVSTKPDGSVTVTVTGEAPDQSEAMIAAALKEAVRSAAAKQATMSPLFATLEELPDRPDLPPAVRQAVQTLLSMRTPLDAPPKPAVLAQAVAKSGLFTEAQLATSPDIPPPLDLKAALSSLRVVVQALVDATQPTTTASAGQQPPASTAPPRAGPQPAPVPGSGPIPSPAPSSQPPLPQTAPTPAGSPPAIPQSSGSPPAQPQSQVPVPVAVSVSQVATASITPSLPAIPAPAAQLAAPAGTVLIQVDEAVRVTTPQNPPATGAAPQSMPAGQGGAVSMPPQTSTLPAPGGMRPQIRHPAPVGQPLLPPPTTATTSAPPMPVAEDGVALPVPGTAVVVQPRAVPPSVSTPALPTQFPVAGPPIAQPQVLLPQVSPAPSGQQGMPQSPQLPAQSVVPTGVQQPETPIPQGQPIPGPLVRAATPALAQAAALPMGEQVLLPPGQQPPPAPGHAYPSAQKPDAPPPTHGSPPLSHAPVPPNDAARTAAQSQPLEEIAPRLLADTDAAISRVSLHQVASLPDDHAPSRFDAPDARWSCEIPIALDGRTALMGFVVERDGKKTDDPRKQKRWRVQAALDLPETGPLQADVQMRGTAVVAGIWVERSDVAHLLEEALPLLRDGLTAAGFDVEELNVRLGHLRSHLPPPGAFLDQRS